MSYPMGGMFGIPHGMANAVLLPYVMAYNVIGCPEKLAVVAEVMGENTAEMTVKEAAQAAVDAIFELNNDVGIPASLEELDIPPEKFPEMADIALTVTRPVENNPRRPSREDVIQIYEEAYHGW